VVARNAANLANRYPGQLTLNVNLLGNYNGTLANSGGRIALIDAAGVVIDEVTYADGGRWGKWIDGGGASLELTDPHSDNRLPSNWNESAPAPNSSWTNLELTGIIQNGDGINRANALELILLDAGECLVDDVEVVPAGANNLIADGTFDAGGGLQTILGDVNGSIASASGGPTNVTCCTGALSLPSGWHAQGSHDLSTIVSRQGINGSSCLHIRTTGRGDHVGNRIFYLWDPNTVLAQGSTCTIRASVKWLRGHPELVLRIRGNYLDAVATMQIPSELGTPGMVNSQGSNNTPPAITEVEHFPIVPAGDELVRVSARVADPNGVSAVTLKYRVDPSATYSELPMNDAGNGGDYLAGDGIYTATIPAQPSDAVVAFVVEAGDSFNLTSRFPEAEALYPGDSFQRECVVRYGEGSSSGSFGVYRIWMTSNTYDQWVQRTKIHNSPLDITFVYGDSRVIYNAGARYAGSIYHSALYDSPDGNLCNYTMAFPHDNPMLGAHSANFDFDDSVPRYYLSEQLAMWMADRLRLPFNHRRFIHLYVHGVLRSDAYEDSQRPNGDFLEQWFPGLDNGQLYKLEVWWKNVDFPIQHVLYRNASLEKFTRVWPGGITSLDLPSYRLTWLPRAVHGSANDYSSLSNLIDSVDNPNDPDYFSALDTMIDYEQWMRVFAFERAVLNGDTYGFGNGHNMYAYHDLGSGLKWKLLMTDFDGVFQDNGLGTSWDPLTIFTSSTLTDNPPTDPKVADMLNYPPFLRAFWRCLYDMANPTDGCMISSLVDPVFDGHYAALQANGFDPPSAMLSSADKNWIAGRRSFLWTQVASVRPAFQITTPNDTHSPSATFTLEGQAPVEAKDLKLNGNPAAITWTGTTTWNITTTLATGANTLTVTGHGWDGAQLQPRDLGDYEDTIIVHYP
jgi:CotH kinase protein